MNNQNQGPPGHMPFTYQLPPAPLRPMPDLTSMSSSIFTPIMEDLTEPLEEFPTESAFIEASIKKLGAYTEEIRGNILTLTECDIKLVMRSIREEERNTIEDYKTPVLSERDHHSIGRSLQTVASSSTKNNVTNVPKQEITLGPDMSRRDRGARTVLILAEKSVMQLNGFREHGKKDRVEWEEELLEARARDNRASHEKEKGSEDTPMSNSGL